MKHNGFNTPASVFLAAILLSGVPVPARADYAQPPSWDPMLMIGVRLDANNNLSVQSTPSIISLTPAPGTYDAQAKTYNLSAVSFDPAQPWSVLNGTALSRVLGWYDPGTTGANGDDFYGTYAAQLGGNSLWIERTGGSLELKTYFVDEASSWNENANGPYTPIFGTGGSPPKWRWDGLMDHNAYAVALGDLASPNQIFFATYHLYVGDASGAQVAGFGDATTTWTWKGPAVVPIPEPSTISLLAAGGLLLLRSRKRAAARRDASATPSDWQTPSSA